MSSSVGIAARISAGGIGFSECMWHHQNTALTRRSVLIPRCSLGTEKCPHALLSDFFHKFKNGLDTEIGEVVAEASSGETQRLTFVRGILRNTPILILDEPTSNLDMGTEQAVVSVIKSLSLDKCVIVITHRTQPLECADFHITLS